jgi:hypothetical protein
MVVMNDFLRIDCDEWLVLTNEFPLETQVIAEMMREADEEFCVEEMPV